MGEIATWSAVKTKVGLGKDSNECPTKAELLALSPTGTGENYVGLEISNASSYGDNETVQLSDIHKVTYTYTFETSNSTVNFTALGVATPKVLSISSNKQKYLDGVATGTPISVKYSSIGWNRDWAKYNENGASADENITTESRSLNINYTQEESGKTFIIQAIQEAGVETWEYNFFVQNSTFNFTALGGKTNPSTLGITSNKQRYINGKLTDTTEYVDYVIDKEFPSWLSANEANEQIAAENKTESSRTFSRIYTQNESSKKFTIIYNQAAGAKTHGDIVITPAGDVPDIPASGGTSAGFPYSYSQPWGWNGKTDDGGTLTTGGAVTWNPEVTGSNLGTTPKGRTKLGVRTVTITMNGKSATLTKDVYQAANEVTKITQGAWEVSISANPSTFTEQGGTSQISASARASRTNTWSSGATNAASDATGTPTLSIPTAVTGFSLSGTTLTVAENTTSNDRSVVVRATMDTVYKEVTVTQSAYLVEWRYYFTTSTPTLNFDALGTTQMPNLNSYREKYINGSLVEGSTEGVSAVKDSTTGPIQDVSPSGITLSENTTPSERTGTVVYKQTGSNKTVTITCKQAAATISTRDVLGWISGISGNVLANGGSVTGIIQSGYWDTVNGKDTSFYPVEPTVVSKPEYVTIEFSKRSSTPEYGDQYTMKITLTENTSESSRVASVELSYGSKSLIFNVNQLGASVTWEYTFKATNSLLKFTALGGRGTPYNVSPVSTKQKYINGTATGDPVSVPYESGNNPDWVYVYDYYWFALENTSLEIRTGTATYTQEESGKTFTIEFEQAAATVTTRDHVEYRTPLPSGDFTAENQGRSIYVISYRETLVNSTVTNKVGVEPTWILSLDTAGSWASLASLGASPSNPYEFEIELTLDENTTNQTRSGSVLFKNGTTEVENAFAFTQDAASIEISYDIYWALSDRGNDLIYRATSYSLDSGGEADRIHLLLLCDKVTTINGVESSRTPVNTGLSNLTNYGPIYTKENDGEPTSIIGDDGGVNENPSLTQFPELSDRGSTYQIVIGSGPNEGMYMETIKMTYNRDVMDGSTPVGKVPAFYWVIDPIPYQRVFEFSWKEGQSITSITLEGDIYDSSSLDIRDIISYESLRRNGVEFNRRYIKPTLIPPSEDWLQVIDNGQNADNTYNYAFRALTNNEGGSARNQSVRFEQSGNGNQSLYAYVSQDPMVTTREEFRAELGNYYSYGDSNQIPLIYQWYSPDSSDTTSIGDMTPGGYSGVWCNLPSTGDIFCMVTGKPQSGKPMKARLTNLQVITIEEDGSSMGTETSKGLSVGYSQQDYKIGIEYSEGMSNYFLITPQILPESGEYGGGIRLEVSLRNLYSQNGTTIATVTLTPKDLSQPTIYFEVIYG